MVCLIERTWCALSSTLCVFYRHISVDVSSTRLHSDPDVKAPEGPLKPVDAPRPISIPSKGATSLGILCFLAGINSLRDMLAHTRALVKRNLAHHQSQPPKRPTDQSSAWRGVMGVCGAGDGAGGWSNDRSRQQTRRQARGAARHLPSPSHPVLIRAAVAQRTRAYKMFGSSILFKRSSACHAVEASNRIEGARRLQTLGSVKPDVAILFKRSSACHAVERQTRQPCQVKPASRVRFGA